VPRVRCRRAGRHTARGCADLGRQGDILRDQDGINGGDHEAHEIVEIVWCIADAQPLPHAVKIGAEGEQQRGFQHHVLFEVGFV